MLEIEFQMEDAVNYKRLFGHSFLYILLISAHTIRMECTFLSFYWSFTANLFG